MEFICCGLLVFLALLGVGAIFAIPLGIIKGKEEMKEEAQAKAEAAAKRAREIETLRLLREQAERDKNRP